jgi:toxin-antitoxin system PIN domain toxin
MKVFDANVLLYAYNADSPHHAAARTWLESAFNAEETIALPWQTVFAFVRIVTNRRAVPRPLGGNEACDIVTQWLARPNVTVIDPEERFWEIFRKLVSEARVSGPLISDAALAALCLEHGATLYSTDKDFRRFQGLTLVDPLRESR